MAKFEVGCSYMRADSGFDPVTVLRRTEKTIWVRDTRSTWAMRIRHDEHGNEFAVESEIRDRDRYTMCFDARWKERE